LRKQTTDTDVDYFKTWLLVSEADELAKLLQVILKLISILYCPSILGVKERHVVYWGHKHTMQKVSRTSFARRRKKCDNGKRKKETL